MLPVDHRPWTPDPDTTSMVLHSVPSWCILDILWPSYLKHKSATLTISPTNSLLIITFSDHNRWDAFTLFHKNGVNHHYYSFKIFPRFWLAKSTRLINHIQLLMTKFGRILCLARKWRQKCSVLAGIIN